MITIVIDEDKLRYGILKSVSEYGFAFCRWCRLEVSSEVSLPSRQWVDLLLSIQFDTIPDSAVSKSSVVPTKLDDTLENCLVSP